MHRHNTENIAIYMIYFGSHSHSERKDLNDRYEYLKIFLSSYTNKVNEETKLIYEYLTAEIVRYFILLFRQMLESLNKNKEDIKSLDIDKSLNLPKKDEEIYANPFIQHYVCEYQKMIYYYAKECLEPDSKIKNSLLYCTLSSALALLANDRQSSKLTRNRKVDRIQYKNNNNYDFPELLKRLTDFLKEKQND